jgi:isopentenyl diphosphate isomerase/L-lactate dehydrogenase-like FMN-dependent dehydrogenase
MEPVAMGDWPARAAAVLPAEVYDWLEGGAGDGSTVRANRAAFERWRLRPRVLTGNTARDTSVTVLGTTSPAPFLLAPIGGQTLMHPDGELATARAAASVGIPMVAGTASSTPIEDIASAAGDSPLWFQLYWADDRELVTSFVDRAVAAGCRAIVVTVDMPVMGIRERDVRNGFAPWKRGAGLAMYSSDPIIRRRLRGGDDPAALRAEVAKVAEAELTWRDVEWLKGRCPVPVLAKGILRGDDALAGLEAGVDGIVVSNHGGRQLDGSVASLDAVREVRDAVGDRAVVLMDGGIRRGPDVVKALALGADAVLVGRPYMYGLAAGGQAGVESVLGALIQDVDRTFALAGVADAAAIGPSFVEDAGA